MVPFCSRNGSDKILLNENAQLLTYMLKSRGLKLQPRRYFLFVSELT